MSKRAEFHRWAQTSVCAACYCSATSSVPLIWYRDDGGLPLAIYNLAIAVLMIPFFWNGQGFEFLGSIRWIVQSWIVNAVLTLALSAYCFRLPPSLLAGFCWVMAAVLFTVAAIRREKGKTKAQLARKKRRK
mmetsp:Transcript_5857/g.6369  ORF Transcript_5857/g.6369 Transcript_5857/m.6369 type:complete len:132 (+) Transcript_5857:19-414(+)